MPRPVTPVAILAERLAGISARVDALGELADPTLAEDVRRVAELAGGLDHYTDRLSTPESTALRSLAERTAREDWAGHSGAGPVLHSVTGALEQEMLSGHLEGQLLKTLVHATGARRVLEIGMFTGYSALAMAEALPEDGTVVACEVDPRAAAIARECFRASPAGDRVEVRLAPARETLEALAEAGEAFDLVFLDADKAGYADYVALLLDRGLLAGDGLLCVDNTLMQGEPWLTGTPSPNGAAIAAFNEVVAADDRVEQVVLPVRDGVTLVRWVRP